MKIAHLKYIKSGFIRLIIAGMSITYADSYRPPLQSDEKAYDSEVCSGASFF